MKLITKIYDETLSTNENQFYDEIQWDLQEKLEYNLTLSDSSISIPVSAIDNIKAIVIETDEDINVYLYRESTNEEFIVSGIFVYTPSIEEDFTSIDMSETNGKEVDIRLRAYGYTPES